jgi:hypothetical protein
LSDPKKILVTVATDSTESEVRQRGFERSGAELRVSPKEFDVEALEDNVSDFIITLQGVLKTAPRRIGEFRLREFTVSAEITAEGKLSLMGIGGGVGTTGGLTFTFEQVAEDSVQ